MTVRRTDLFAAALHGFPSPVPTQNVSSDESIPRPQSRQQRKVEVRVTELADQEAKRHGFTRRRFFQTASGMAASFLAMNQVFGSLFMVSCAEVQTPELARARAVALRNQFIFDCHTHHLHEPLSQALFDIFLGLRRHAREAGWNPAIPDRPGKHADLLYENYVKEMFLDSDTKVALISSAPADDQDSYFLTNAQMEDDRRRINATAGSRRLFSHGIIEPGRPGSLDDIDRQLSTTKPDSWKGYTIGDPTASMRVGRISSFAWRMDDEHIAYPTFEKIARSTGSKIVCIHKGLFPLSAERRFPNLRAYSDVSDVGKAARDWPQLSFIIYHAGYRHVGGDLADATTELETTGRLSWVSDLAEIPAKYGVTNVYADIGMSFAEVIVANPRLAAAMMGILIRGLGKEHVVWGTDALWTGSPQWQIEGLRRLEIPEDMQRRYGYSPLGPADGSVKNAIFGLNSARLYGYQPHAERSTPDHLDLVKAEYERNGAEPSNLRYGLISKPV
jgi:predicted TIM-barrel fold metal-dependent hydrolase